MCFSWFGKLRFRLMLVLLSTLTISLSIVIVAAVCNHIYEDTMLKSTHQSVGDFASSSSDVISQWASNAHNTGARINSIALAEGRTLPTQESESLTNWKSFYKVIMLPEMLISHLYWKFDLGFDDGSRIGFHMVVSPVPCIIMYTAIQNLTGWTKTQVALAPEKGYPSAWGLDTPIANSDIRSEEWYKMGGTQSSWFGPGVDALGGLIVKLVRNIENETHAIGRVAITVNLQGLSTLLSEFNGIPGAQLTITSKDVVIGTSNPPRLNPTVPTSEMIPDDYVLSVLDVARKCITVSQISGRYKLCPYTINMFGSQPLSDVYDQMPDLFDPYNVKLGRNTQEEIMMLANANGLWRSNPSTTRTFRSEGKEYIVGSASISIPNTINTDWILTVIVPKSEITSEFISVRIKVILITLALVIVAGLITGVSTHFILRSIADTALLMRAAKYFRLPKATPTTEDEDENRSAHDTTIPFTIEEQRTLKRKLSDRTESRWKEIADIQVEYWSTRDELRQIKKRLATESAEKQSAEGEAAIGFCVDPAIKGKVAQQDPKLIPMPGYPLTASNPMEANSGAAVDAWYYPPEAKNSATKFQLHQDDTIFE